MPGEAFYTDIGLAAQIQKFADHHHDPDVRHISTAEAELLRHAAERLREGLDGETSPAKVLIASGSLIVVAGGLAIVVARRARRRRAEDDGHDPGEALPPAVDPEPSDDDGPGTPV